MWSIASAAAAPSIEPYASIALPGAPLPLGDPLMSKEEKFQAIATAIENLTYRELDELAENFMGYLPCNVERTATVVLAFREWCDEHRSDPT